MPSVLSYFPDGLRILVIDSDEASLNDVVQKLKECKYYTVTPCTKASSALDILSHAKGAFDLLLTETRIADMDGLSLLRHVRKNFAVPIVIMSTEQKTELAVECLNSGACFYLDKPIQCSVLATIWQHAVITRRPNTCTDIREIDLVLGQPSSCSVTGELNELEGKERTAPHRTSTSPATEELPVPQLRQEEELAQIVLEVEELVSGANADSHDEEMADDTADEEDDTETNDGGDDVSGAKEGNDVEADAHVDDEKEKKAIGDKSKKPKKARVVWTRELHHLFLEAIEKLGVDKACPRKILEVMNKQELSRAHVASHLQKYRQYIRKKAEGKRHCVGRTSRFPVSKRKSVFDSTPSKPTSNYKNQMDVVHTAPAPASYTTTPQSAFHSCSSTSSASSTIATTYMGFSLTPQQYPQPQQQNQSGQGLGKSTVLFDGRQRTSNFFGFQCQGSFSAGLSSYGLNYASGQSSTTPRQHTTPAAFNTMPYNIAGNFETAGSLNAPSLLGSTSNNNNATSSSSTLLTMGNPVDHMTSSTLLTMGNPVDHTSSTLLTMGNPVDHTAGIGLQHSYGQPAPNAMGNTTTTNFVGLQIEPTTGQLGFSQNSSNICSSSDLFLQDVTCEANAGIDYDFLDQFIQGDLPIVSNDHKRRSAVVLDNNAEKSLEVEATRKQIDSSISDFGQNGSTITSNECNSILPAEVAINPPEQPNRISISDFTGIGFDLGEDVTFESFTSLLFDQEPYDGRPLAKKNTNFTGARDDKQGED